MWGQLTSEERLLRTELQAARVARDPQREQRAKGDLRRIRKRMDSLDPDDS